MATTDDLELAACYLDALAQADARLAPRRRQQLVDAVSRVSPALPPETIPALLAVYDGQLQQRLDADKLRGRAAAASHGEEKSR